MPILRLALLAAVWLAAAPATAETPWWSQVPDTYDGEIYSGSGYAAGSTEFSSGEKGLTGRYGFTERDGTVIEGTLDHCASPEPFVLLCRWTDRYGSGSLAIDFDESLQRFDALWWADGDTKVRAPWWGKRRIGS